MPDAGAVGEFSVCPVTPDLWPAFVDLFGKPGGSNGCWCMYWRLGPEYHRRPRELNETAMHYIVEAGPPPGLLAFAGDVPVGWCQLTPRHALPWLEHRFAAVDDTPVLVVSCFFVRRGYRGRGVVSALLEGAIEAAYSAGAPTLEAYPVDMDAPRHTNNDYSGRVSTFTRAGFRVVARPRADRPVMRLDLATPTARRNPARAGS
jgi:GNAT superfamily N-acetyltransferase